ncbi:MAG: Nramp family divalent metal transporter [Campylobacteraceae bacterium]|nr:Nramp family divalent metal transporter [Campylobacteraceae bacterium]
MKKYLLRYFAVFGPGIVVMLADTDAGSVITAAQSGAVWGYKLLLLQLVLIPIVYVVQELAVRLGLTTGKGHGELIKEYFGQKWAWFSVSTLVIACIGALITEFAGIAGAGLLFGIPTWISVSATVSLLIVIAWSGSYRSVERVAIILGAFELVFLYVAWQAHPDMAAMAEGLASIPWRDSGYVYLAVANIGAVIMPWMVFYHQSAVIDKGMTREHLKIARIDTAIGAVVTQLIMIAILVATAATIGKYNPGQSLNTVQQIADALTPFLGKTIGIILFSLGLIGASLVAAIVVSLAAAWGVGEVSGFKHSLEDHPKEAPWFYIVYTLVLIIGGIVVISGVNLIVLSVAVQVMNAALLPIVLGFLYLLALKALPHEYRLKGSYSIVVGIIIVATSLTGVYAGVTSVI